METGANMIMAKCGQWDIYKKLPQTVRRDPSKNVVQVLGRDLPHKGESCKRIHCCHTISVNLGKGGEVIDKRIWALWFYQSTSVHLHF